MHYDVIIVGAGMIGATLACALAQQNMHVLIIDSAKTPILNLNEQPGLRISAIQLASVNLLKQLKIWPLLCLKRMRPFTQMMIEETSDQSELAWLDRLIGTTNSVKLNCLNIDEPVLGYFIENDILQVSLHERLMELPTVHLITEVRIDQFLTESCHLKKEILLSNGNQYVAPLIIGADGMHSQVRDWAGIQAYRKTYGQSAFVSTVELSEDPGSVTWQTFMKKGPVALLPLPNCSDRYYASLVWYQSPSENQALMSLSESDLIQTITDYFPKRLPAIKSIRSKGTFPLAKQSVNAYIRQGVALIGDAAHTVHPLAGQGVNLGFQDVIALTEVIVEAWQKKQDYASVDILEKYQSQRRTDNQYMIWILDAFHYGFTSQKIPIKLLRRFMLLGGQQTKINQKITEYGSGKRFELFKNVYPISSIWN